MLGYTWGYVSCLAIASPLSGGLQLVFSVCELKTGNFCRSFSEITKYSKICRYQYLCIIEKRLILVIVDTKAEANLAFYGSTAQPQGFTGICTI